MKRSAVLVTASGKDAPGITAALTRILAAHSVPILDIGQAVIHNLLSLSILFELDPKAGEGSEKPVIKDLLFQASEMGLKLDFQVLPLSEATTEHLTAKDYRYAITLIADRVTAHSLHEVTATLAKHNLNIDTIERLSDGRFSCVEMIVSTAKDSDRRSLKKELLEIASTQGVDIALQAEGLYRRAKRLIVFDMDSTLIQNEVIDELAREFGCYEQVSEVTETAMKGKIPFDEALKKRVALLKGLTPTHIQAVIDRIKPTPGASDLIKVLQKLGYKTALISGGFTVVADMIKQKLGIDYAYANQLEMNGGVATGNVHPPIVNAQRKADLLDLISQQERISLDQVIAVGDGANDILMLEKAGLGIAFNAKPVVREKADLALSQKSLDSILYLLGISGRDLADVLNV